MRSLGKGIMAGMLLLALAGCQRQEAAMPESRASSAAQAAAPQGPAVHIVALGDSLLAGYGLRTEEAYPPRLEAALRARGINAQVVNAGVSGDTTADGLARLDFTLASQNPPPDLVLLSLGGNDMLRGLPVAQAKANLDAILTRLEDRHIRVVVLGMLAAPNMGPDYAGPFNAMFAQLARKHHAALVPFFLKAVYQRPGLQLPDHIHPTAPGVEAMVADTIGVVTGALGCGQKAAACP